MEDSFGRMFKVSVEIEDERYARVQGPMVANTIRQKQDK